MKGLKSKKMTKVMVGALAALVFILAAAPYHLDAGICEKAFQRCMVDATISGLFGGPGTGSAYAAGCGIGYAWCLRYIY